MLGLPCTTPGRPFPHPRSGEQNPGGGGCFWAPALLPRAESLSLSLPSALSLSFLFSFPLSSSAPSHSWQFQPHPSFWDIG